MLPPVLKSERLHLKPYDLSDEDRFVEMALDEKSTHFMGGANGIEAEERALFRTVSEIYKRDEKRWFWIWGIYRADVLCGHLEMKETEHTSDGELEIVYMIHPDERRKGIMTEALEILRQKQQSWNRRIIATVSHKNLASISLLEKWGIEKRETLKNKESDETYLKLTLTT